MLAAESKAVTSAPVLLSSEAASSWKQIVEPVEPFLDAVHARLLKQVSEFDPATIPYADYSLNGNGKNLRPALVALSANALSKTSEAHIVVAVIIEMVHLATLVHDDVIDEAEIRRGRPTLAANWGNEIAVLFGDCLFAQALKLAASFPTPEVCRAVAAATNTVCSGEILQTQNRRNFKLSRSEYFRIVEMKTAELFALSCDLAAHLSGASAAERNALRQFGLAFGTAYQIYDDCVDLFGSESAAGKSLGTDLAKGKLTLPVLLLWERASQADRARLEELVCNWEPGALVHMSALLAKYQTMEPSFQVIAQYLQKARQTLAVLPDSPGRTSLLGITEYLARQTQTLFGPESGL
ncbi:MAG TPA: polyprenyl synthetase family protein [Verrucomicrobia bacterium]|nr:polyprenyl synthetase family protein [Verrucomicrobiota bacterium]HOB32892.1 polyprenyl synthetase family protein [Verrucomicrobiota bacterium]